MRWRIWIPVFALFVLLGGCGEDAAIEQQVPAQDMTTAKHYIALLQNRQFDQLEKDLDPGLKSAKAHETFVAMAGLLPQQAPLSAKVVDWRASDYSSTLKAWTTVNLTYEYQFSDKWLIINVASQKSATGVTLTGMHVYQSADSLEHINRFTLAGKGPLHYFVLLSCVLIPLLMIFAVVCCIRSKEVKRKWLWILFILVGLGQFSLNWTTGEWLFHPVSLLLLGESYFAPLFGGWTLSISLPLGALLFLWTQSKSLLRSGADSRDNASDSAAND